MICPSKLHEGDRDVPEASFYKKGVRKKSCGPCRRKDYQRLRHAGLSREEISRYYQLSAHWKTLPADELDELFELWKRVDEYEETMKPLGAPSAVVVIRPMNFIVPSAEKQAWRSPAPFNKGRDNVQTVTRKDSIIEAQGS